MCVQLYILNFILHFVCFYWEGQVGYLAEKCIFFFPPAWPWGAEMTIPCSQESKPRRREDLERAAVTGSAGAAWEGVCPLPISFPPKNY